MIRLWDGFLSLIAAAPTAVIVGVPVGGAVQAVRTELLPLWGWGPLGLLATAGVVMVLSFLRKAGRGVHPLRERRR